VYRSRSLKRKSKRLESALIVSLLAHMGAVLLLPAESVIFVSGSQSLHGVIGSQRISRYHVTLINFAPGSPRITSESSLSKRQGVALADESEQSPTLVESSMFIFSDKLDRLPEAVGEIELDPEYGGLVPASVGSAELQLLILETGEVGLVSVNSSSFSEKYNQLLIERFVKARFTPGFKSGLPVKTLIRIEVVAPP
jgi:hypothetical protein